LQLTAAGVRVINFAAETLDAYDRLCMDVAGTPADAPSKVVIGVPGPSTASRLLRVLGKVPRMLRETGVEFCPSTYAEILDALRTARADYGVVMEEPTAADDLESVHLWSDGWCLAVPNTRDFQIASAPLACAMPSRGTYARRAIETTLHALGFTVVPAVEAPYVETLVEALVSAGLPAFVPESAISALLAAGTAREIDLPGAPIDVSAWLLFDSSRHDSTLTSALLGLLHDAPSSCSIVGSID
jgi:DNA-binding transcriptional LysR family regulator